MRDGGGRSSGKKVVAGGRESRPIRHFLTIPTFPLFRNGFRRKGDVAGRDQHRVMIGGEVEAIGIDGNGGDQLGVGGDDEINRRTSDVVVRARGDASGSRSSTAGSSNG